MHSMIDSSIWLPPPDITVSEWADNYRYLSNEASAEPGRWNTDRAPYQREMMDAVKTCERIVIMTAAQVGKSELLLNTIGYFADKDPSPILMLQPTLEMGEAFSKDRLAPMIRDTPALTEKFPDPKSRFSGNTLLHKIFPGGHITIAGANSPAGLASRPVRILLCDEVDRYPLSAGSEGDPVSLAIKRTANFWNRRIILVSTPTMKGNSRIEKAYALSTQEEWCVPCPKCGEYQAYTWERIIWKERITPVMRCQYCGHEGSERDWKAGAGRWLLPNTENNASEGTRNNSENEGKYSQNESRYSQNEGKYAENDGGYTGGKYSQNEGRYSQNEGKYAENDGAYTSGRYSQNEDIGTSVRPAFTGQRADYCPSATRPQNLARGFHLNAFASPWVSWQSIISSYHEAYSEGEEALKVWTNTVLGEPYEIKEGTIDANNIESRAEPYGKYLPDGVQLLTCGVDVQDNRLELEVLGWGAGYETWGIEYRVLYGTPGASEVWQVLDDYLAKTWPKSDGQELGIACTCIDSGGHFTDSVYKFVQTRGRRHIHAIVGRGTFGHPCIAGPTRHNRRKIPLFTLGVSTLKGMLFSRLQAEKGETGYCHFPNNPDSGYDAVYFKGLLSERMVIHRRSGRDVLDWEKRQGVRRNEPLDCRVYAMGAYELLNPKLDRPNKPQIRQIRHVMRKRLSML